MNGFVYDTTIMTTTYRDAPRTRNHQGQHRQPQTMHVRHYTHARTPHNTTQSPRATHMHTTRHDAIIKGNTDNARTTQPHAITKGNTHAHHTTPRNHQGQHRQRTYDTTHMHAHSMVPWRTLRNRPTPQFPHHHDVHGSMAHIAKQAHTTILS